MNNKKLTLEELEYVQKEVNTNTKGLPAAYLLAIFLGPFGIHRAYFGKKKSAILKAIVSLFGITAFLMIILNMTTLDLNARITREILANYATLAIAFVLPTLISGIWSFVDLFLIPKWKRTWDENNKNKAVEEVVQARYVKGQILRKELTEELIKQAKLDTINEIKRIVDNLDKEELNKLNVLRIPELPEELEIEIEEEIHDDEFSDNNVEISKDDDKVLEVVYETEN
jgi:TM2 domain-containing membrane protein YozV